MMRHPADTNPAYIKARRIHVWKLRQDGLTFRAIGERIGVSAGRAAQLVALGDKAANCHEPADELSPRTLNCLRAMKEFWVEVPTPEKVAAIPVEVLLTAKNFGKKSAAELRAWCQRHGFAIQAGGGDPVRNERRRLQAISLLQNLYADTGNDNVSNAIALLSAVTFK